MRRDVVADFLPILIGLVLVAALVEVYLRESPREPNVERLARKVRRSADRKGVHPLALLERMRVANRLSARILVGFAGGALVLAVGLTAWLAARQGPAYAFVVMPLPLIAAAVSFASGIIFLVSAPRLIERVRVRLETDASTTKEPDSMPARSSRSP